MQHQHQQPLQSFCHHHSAVGQSNRLGTITRDVRGPCVRVKTMTSTMYATWRVKLNRRCNSIDRIVTATRMTQPAVLWAHSPRVILFSYAELLQWLWVFFRIFEVRQLPCFFIATHYIIISKSSVKREKKVIERKVRNELQTSQTNEQRRKQLTFIYE